MGGHRAGQTFLDTQLGGGDFLLFARGAFGVGVFLLLLLLMGGGLAVEWREGRGSVKGLGRNKG